MHTAQAYMTQSYHDQTSARAQKLTQSSMDQCMAPQTYTMQAHHSPLPIRMDETKHDA